MPSAGQIIKAQDFTADVEDTENTSGTTNSTSFTATLTGGTACELTFTAPTSGKVRIHNSSDLVNSTAASSVFCGFRIGTGSTPGAGTEVLAAAQSRSVVNVGTSRIRATVSILVTGLTAGSTYNVQQQFSVGSNTGTYMNKRLAVEPAF